MLGFVVNATDPTGHDFPVVIQIPTRSGEAECRWGTTAGTLSFRGGPAIIVASPAQNRGMLMCFGLDADNHQWAAVEIDHFVNDFTRRDDGSYAITSLNQSGTGQTFPDTVVSVQAGKFSWKMMT